MMNLPKIFSEDQIFPFNYYWEGEIRSGMALHGKLYALLWCFPEEERVIAFERGAQLSEKFDILITKSDSIQVKYRVWVLISSNTDGALLETTTHHRRCSEEKMQGNLSPLSF